MLRFPLAIAAGILLCCAPSDSQELDLPAPPLPTQPAVLPPDPTSSLPETGAIDSSPSDALPHSESPSAATPTANAVADSSASPDSVPAIPATERRVQAEVDKPRSTLKRIPAVAVLTFVGAGLAEKDLAAVTSRFESELVGTDSFRIVERRNIDRILREQGFQQSGACDNSECSVEIGQILSVEGIYTGELARVGKTWILSVKRTDVATGQTTFSHVLDIQGDLETVLRGGCPEMALIASGRKKPTSERSILVAKQGSVWPWIAGGTAVVGGGVIAAILLTRDDPGNSSPPPSSTEPDQLIVKW